MKVSVTAVKALAKNAGIPPELVDRHIDEFINFAFVVAKRERKHCVKTVRNWYYSTDIMKPTVLEVLLPMGEKPDDTYDIV